MESLVLTTLLLALLSAGTAQLQYALSIPAKLNSGESGKACMNLQGYRQTLYLNVVLQYSGINITIFAEYVAPPKYFQCNSFQVPVVQEDVPVLVLLSVYGSVHVLERYSVVITASRNIYLVQMDKPIYKPGQKVRFTLVSMDQQLLPVNETYSLVYLTDPSGSRLVQWLDQKSHNGLVSLEFSLVNDAVPGFYFITAQRASDFAASQGFSVEEYVLPRFDVTLKAPYSLSILDKTIKFDISAMYTYGQPVPGAISIQWCREPTYGRVNNCFKDKNGVCFYKTAQLAANGTYRGELDLNSMQMDLAGARASLNLSITVTETGTGVQVTKTQYLWVTGQLANILFDYQRMNRFYKRGLQYSVLVFLNDENGLPIAGQDVELNIEGVQDTQHVKTGSDGAAKYEIDTSDFVNPNFTIRASYPNAAQCYYTSWQGTDYPTAEYLVYRFYSVTGSFLQIVLPLGPLKCGTNQNIKVKFILSTEGAGAGATKATFYYLTMSRSRIVYSGQHEVPITPGMKGTFSFNLPITSEIAFITDLLVYSILQKELIADTVSLNIESCFKNEVSLGFSKEVGPPGSNVDLHISASPGSLCAVKVIDSSVLLLNSYTGLTPETVFYSMQYWVYGYQVGQFNVEQPGPPCEDPNKQIFCNGHYYLPVSSDSDGDTYNNLKSISLIVGTNVTVRKPEVCRQGAVFYPGAFQSTVANKFASAMATSALDSKAGGSATIESIRRNFTDTWVWTMISADPHGNGTISQKVPDTITKWTGSMICTSKKDGFGMTKNPATFTTFLPFFIEMSLPYSFIRGEILVLNAFVSNYLKKCVKVQISLKADDNYVALLQEENHNACICSGKRASYIWNISAKSLGVISFTISAQTTYIGQTCDGANDPSQPSRKDTVIQSVIVEAEGIKKEATSSNLICNLGQTPLVSSIPMKLVLPTNLVPGSASAFITFLGDIVVLPLQNLQNLLQMPFGCGEQNLVRMAPIPYLLDYLNSTGQLTKQILQKGIEFMNIGYYRELRYKSWSGAYSLFGGFNNDENSRLTVYVFKTLEQCKRYIYIDDSIQQQTLIWLQNAQKLDSGCFSAVGGPFMTWGGKKDDDLSYTAYLAIALLESNYSIGMTLLDGALTCLQNSLNGDQGVYNQALMLYAFTLAHDWSRRFSLLRSLKSKAISEGGMIHWEREDKPTARLVDFFYPVSSPAEVEITAYILMSIAKSPNITQEDLTYMSQISVWLMRQQNSYGGFRSTQDTVVALQALSTFAKLVFTPNAQQSIQLKEQDTIISNVMLNMNNRLLVQRQSLNLPGDYSILVNGTGCCLIQATIQYNVPVPHENSAFLLSVNTSLSCVNGVAYTFTIGISVSYRGKRPQTNMVIIDMTMLSGYQADYWSLQGLVNSKVISNFVTNNNHVFLYLSSVSRNATYLSFNVMMGNRVLNVKTASISVYDYYETDENGYASYNHPCAQS